MTWSIAGTDAARFSINEDGELSFRSSPNYEAPNDANTDNVYEVTIRASDGSLMSTLDVEVTVTDANESGAITGPTSIDYPENDTTVATYSTNDPEDDDITWSVAGTDAARFSINENGELTFRSSPNYEAPNDANTDNVYEVTMRASDGNLMSTLNVEVTVTTPTNPARSPAPRPSTTQRTTPRHLPSPPIPQMTRKKRTTSQWSESQARTRHASPSTRAGTDIQVVAKLRSPERRQRRTTCTR